MSPPVRRRRGLLVALEGIDGSGKSTLAGALAAGARRRGWTVRRRREPADERLGAIAQAASVGDAWTGAIYFTVDRFLARPGLQRDLERSDVVIQDRSFYSTLAYQGSALPAPDRHRLESIERVSSLRPDVVFLLDLPVDEALARLGGRSGRRDPLERRRTLRRVARTYRALARRPGWRVLDGRRPTRDLAREALDRLAPKVRRRAARRPAQGR